MTKLNNPTDSDSQFDGKVVGWTATIIILVIALMWIPPLWSSFWLDETVTAWIGSVPLASAVDRAREFQFGSPYFIISWISLRLPLEPIELRARIPSFFFAVAAVPFVFLSAQRLASRQTACFAVLFFTASSMTCFVATDARPYALALLLITASAWLHICWLQEFRLRDGVASVILAGATVFVHMFAGIFLAAVCLSMLLQWRCRPKAVTFLVFIAVILLFLYCPTALETLTRAKSLSWSSWKSSMDLVNSVLQAPVTLPLFVAMAIGTMKGKFNVARFCEAGQLGAFFWLWFGLPIATLFVLSLASGLAVMVPRYAVASLPAAAIWLANVATKLPLVWRRTVFWGCPLMGFLLVLSSGGGHANQDWRTLGTRLASAGASAQSAVFFRSGLVEGNTLSFLVDPGLTEYLMAPSTIYPVPGRLSPLPFNSMGGAAGALVQQRLAGVIQANEPFFLAGLLPDWLVKWVEQMAPNHEAQVVDRQIVRFQPIDTK